MMTLLVMSLFAAMFAGFIAFVHFCEWVLSRLEVKS
jgi:hypothetical protein